MKKIILLIAILCLLQITKAQKNQNVYFFKNSGKEVKTKESADYIRVIQEPDSGETNFNLLEFYANGKRKTIGTVSAFDPWLVYEGLILRFNTEGKRKEITTYEKGVPLGMSYRYFDNGKVRTQIEYLAFLPEIFPTAFLGAGLAEIPFNPNSKLIYLADSLGKVYVEEGAGYTIDTVKMPSGENIEEGSYMDGVKHGVWKGAETANGMSFIETYEGGKLIGGESIREGVKYKYTFAMQAPSFKGGMAKFYQYLGSSMRYPNDATKNNIEGTVIVEYTVEKDGRLVEVQIKKSVYPSIDEEAKRVIRSSPKWIPATMRGVPVRVKHSIPLKFTMPR